MPLLTELASKVRRTGEKWSKGATTTPHQMDQGEWDAVVAPVFRQDEGLDLSRIETMEDVERLQHAFLNGNQDAVNVAKSRSLDVTKARIRKEVLKDLQDWGLSEDEALAAWTAKHVPKPVVTRLDNTDLVEQANRRLVGAVDEAKGYQARLDIGEVPDPVIQDLAEASHMSYKDILQRLRSKTWNAETMFRAITMTRQINHNIIEKVKALPRKADGNVNFEAIAPETKIALLQASHIAAALHIQVQGAKSEAGRVLRIVQVANQQKTMAELRVKAGDTTQSVSDAVSNIYEKRGVTIDQQLMSIIDVVEHNPSNIGRQVVDLSRATSFEMLTQMSYNNMLGSFRTDGVNIGSNFLVGLLENIATIQGGLAGGVARTYSRAVGRARPGSTGGVDPDTSIPFGANDGLTLSAGLRQMVMTLHASFEAAYFAGKVLIDRKPPVRYAGDPTKPRTVQSAAEKFHGTQEGVITVDSLKALVGKKPDPNAPLAPDSLPKRVTDAALDLATRHAPILLASEDAFFKTIWYRATIQEMAVSEGMKQGLRGRELRRYVRDIQFDPQSQAPHLHQEAVRRAQEYTFTEGPGFIGQRVSDLLYNLPGGGRYTRIAEFLGRVVVPFYNILNNLVKYAIHTTTETQVIQEVGTQGWRGLNAIRRIFGADPADAPANVAMGKFSRGLHSPNPRERDYYWGKALLGAELTLMGIMFSREGMILGGDDARAWVDNAKAEKRRIRYTPGEGEYMLVIPWSVLDPENQYKGVYHDGHDMAYLIDRYDPMGAYLANAAALGQASEAHTAGDSEARNAMFLKSIYSVGSKMTDATFTKNVLTFWEAFVPAHPDTSRFGENQIPRAMKWLAQNTTRFVPVAGHNFTKDLRNAEDPYMRGTDPKLWKIETGPDGQTMVRIRPTDVTDHFVLYAENLNNMLKARVPADLAESVTGVRYGSVELAKKTDFWGDDRRYPKHVGDGGMYWNNVKTEERQHNQQRLIDAKVFTEDEVKSAMGLRGLRFGLAKTRYDQEMTDAQLERATAERTRWLKFLEVGGLYAEFERLGWHPSRHPQFIMAGETRIPLTEEQMYDFVKIINGKGDEVGLPEAWAADHPNDPYSEVENRPGNEELFTRVRNFMETPRYQNAADHEADAMEGKENKPALLQAFITKARRGPQGSAIDDGLPTGDHDYGGAYRGLLILHPELREAVDLAKTASHRKKQGIATERLEGRIAQELPREDAPFWEELTTTLDNTIERIGSWWEE